MIQAFIQKKIQNIEIFETVRRNIAMLAGEGLRGKYLEV